MQACPGQHSPQLTPVFVLLKVLVSQSCLTLGNPMNCSPPGSFTHGILQARILEYVPISSSRGSSRPRDLTWVSCTARRFFTEPPGKLMLIISEPLPLPCKPESSSMELGWGCWLLFFFFLLPASSHWKLSSRRMGVLSALFGDVSCSNLNHVWM